MYYHSVPDTFYSRDLTQCVCMCLCVSALRRIIDVLLSVVRWCVYYIHRILLQHTLTILYYCIMFAVRTVLYTCMINTYGRPVVNAEVYRSLRRQYRGAYYVHESQTKFYGKKMSVYSAHECCTYTRLTCSSRTDMQNQTIIL